MKLHKIAKQYIVTWVVQSGLKSQEAAQTQQNFRLHTNNHTRQRKWEHSCSSTTHKHETAWDGLLRVSVRNLSSSEPCLTTGVPFLISMKTTQRTMHTYQQHLDVNWFCSTAIGHQHEKLLLPTQKPREVQASSWTTLISSLLTTSCSDSIASTWKRCTWSQLNPQILMLMNVCMMAKY